MLLASTCTCKLNYITNQKNILKHQVNNSINYVYRLLIGFLFTCDIKIMAVSSKKAILIYFNSHYLPIKTKQ